MANTTYKCGTKDCSALVVGRCQETWKSFGK